MDNNKKETEDILSLVNINKFPNMEFLWKDSNRLIWYEVKYSHQSPYYGIIVVNKYYGFLDGILSGQCLITEGGTVNSQKFRQLLSGDVGYYCITSRHGKVIHYCSEKTNWGILQNSELLPFVQFYMLGHEAYKEWCNIYIEPDDTYSRWYQGMTNWWDQYTTRPRKQ